MTPHEYRSLVLRQTAQAWPEEISPQVLRTRLAAYKEALCDQNFRLGVCACCAREKLERQLRIVEFPSATCDEPPHWLGWSSSEWLEYRDHWYQQGNDVLDIDAYLQNVFEADKVVRAAETALADLESSNATASADSGGTSLSKSR